MAEAYKTTPTVPAPPDVYHVELSEEEYNVIREACYQFHVLMENNTHTRYTGQYSGSSNERADEVATNLYNTLPGADHVDPR